MEDKKRRPRIKPGTDSPLKERDESSETSNSFENQSPPASEKPWQDRNQEGGYERKPWQDRNQQGGGGYERKPWQDRNQQGGGGYERKPWQDRNQQGGGGYERKPWQDRNQQGGGGYERKPWQDRNQQGGGGYERKPWQDRNQEGSGDYERKPWQDRNQEGGGGYERKPWQDRNQQGGGGYERKPWQDRNQQGGGGYERKPWQDRNQQGGGGYERKPWQDRNQQGGGGYERKPWQDRNQQGGGGYERKPWQDRNQEGGGGYQHKPWQKGGFNQKSYNKRPFRKKDDFFIERKPKPGLPSGEGMPLNKYLAHCGIASRRKAVDFIKNGLVLVNGEAKTEPFYRVQPGDKVICEGNSMAIQERQVYVLLNKPKNVITTTEDEHGRATVLDIVDPHYPERLYPVGRLDRDTTGLILLTNDGDLSQKLTHPSYAVHKQYRVGLRSPLTQADFEQIERGVELEDGPMEVNWIRFSQDHPDRTIIELEITSGRNRIVRRLFEHLGYEVFKLDRFYFAGLTKKDLARGSFRELTQREIIMLKHFTGHPSTGKKRKNTAEGEVEETDVEHEEVPEQE